MSTLIIDIETVGEDFDSLDQATQDSLTQWIKRAPSAEQEKYTSQVKNSLGLSPLTGQIIAIGVLDADKDKGAIYFDANDANSIEKEVAGIKIRSMNEKEMLEHFWRIVSEYDSFVSFNGRCFDIPFLMIRSAAHNIRPSKNLMINRYLENQDYDAKHIDLMDQLSFYGAVRRKGNLHMWCRVFGIASPKTSGITGADIKHLYDEGRFEDIISYNTSDLTAIRALYHHWKKNLAF